MTPAVDVRPPRRRMRRTRASDLIVIVTVVVLAATAFVGLDAFALRDPRFIERVSIDNPTDYDVHVSVAGEHGGRLPLGVAAQHCVTTFELVVDQGDVWRIGLRAQDRSGGDALVDRVRLVASNWTFRIPDTVAAQLARSGAPLPPRQAC